jgi:hypothetical protein
MSEQNTTTTASEQAAEAQATEAAPAKLYATRAEAEANKPTGDVPKSLKVFEVSKAGATVGFIWARGYDHALAVVARIDGYAVSLGGKTAPVTKEAVAAKLAEFTDEELAAMGLSRKPQKGAKR